MKFSAATMFIMFLVLMVAISINGKAEAGCCSIFNTHCCGRNKNGRQVRVGKNIMNGLSFHLDGGNCGGCEIGWKC
jgi:hypothetical protein